MNFSRENGKTPGEAKTILIRPAANRGLNSALLSVSECSVESNPNAGAECNYSATSQVSAQCFSYDTTHFLPPGTALQPSAGTDETFTDNTSLCWFSLLSQRTNEIPSNSELNLLHTCCWLVGVGAFFFFEEILYQRHAPTIASFIFRPALLMGQNSSRGSWLKLSEKLRLVVSSPGISTCYTTAQRSQGSARHCSMLCIHPLLCPISITHSSCPSVT